MMAAASLWVTHSNVSVIKALRAVAVKMVWKGSVVDSTDLLLSVIGGTITENEGLIASPAPVFYDTYVFFKWSFVISHPFVLQFHEFSLAECCGSFYITSDTLSSSQQ
jgi:hypothetical protein